MDFYQKHVQEHFNVSNKICLVTDPRPENPVGKTYTVDGLGNVIGGRLTVYNNQPIGNYWEWMPKKYRPNSHKNLGAKTQKSPI